MRKAADRQSSREREPATLESLPQPSPARLIHCASYVICSCLFVRAGLAGQRVSSVCERGGDSVHWTRSFLFSFHCFSFIIIKRYIYLFTARVHSLGMSHLLHQSLFRLSPCRSCRQVFGVSRVIASRYATSQGKETSQPPFPTTTDSTVQDSTRQQQSGSNGKTPFWRQVEHLYHL